MCHHPNEQSQIPPSTTPKKQVRKFKLDARKEGILLDMAPGDKEYGIEYYEKIDWHPFEPWTGRERMVIIYHVNNRKYAYEKFRSKEPSGEYKHWTGRKDWDVTTIEEFMKMKGDAVR